jgi:prepilin peptidase CpaA
MIEALIFVVFPFCMVFAAVSDMMSMTIANRVSLLLVATFALAAPMTGMEWSQFGLHFAAAFLVLAVTFGLFAIGAMGGGDAKLLAATALWMGFGIELLQYVVYGGVLGGLLTLMILRFRSSPIAVVTATNPLLRHFADRDAGIPYGVALGAAGLLMFPATPLAQWALQRVAFG